MVRPRSTSSVSEVTDRDQELGGLYDYLCKIILIGPSGCGKSCLLHRFVKDEWRVLSSQTIGVEFASKIIKIGTGARKKRIKLQLWDTAGTERFRSVSRSYYRGAAGAILVYDISQHHSFDALPTFLNDARALASPHLTVVLAGNKCDIESAPNMNSTAGQSSDQQTPSSSTANSSLPANDDPSDAPNSKSAKVPGIGAQQRATEALSGREVDSYTASHWASQPSVHIPVALEVSALTGDNVSELFERLAKMILTKIELGEIDPDDPQSGIQYGSYGYDAGSIKSGFTVEDEGVRRRKVSTRGGPEWMNGLREWEEVFKIDRRRNRCC